MKKGRRYQYRSRKFNEHHIKPKCKGGDSSEKNLIRMDINRHDAFHLLFGNRTFEGAARLLLRVSKIKERR